MLNIERILKQERLVRAMTGLNLKAFKALESSFEEAYQQKTSSEIKRREDISIFPHCQFKVKQPCDVSS